METKIERQEVSDEHPLQYKLTSYKSLTDFESKEFFVVDKVEIKNTIELDIELEQLEKQKLELQKQIVEVESKIDDVNNKKARIAVLEPKVEPVEVLEEPIL